MPLIWLYMMCDKTINYKLMFKNIKLRKCYYINFLLNIYRKQIYILKKIYFIKLIIIKVLIVTKNIFIIKIFK